MSAGWGALAGLSGCATPAPSLPDGSWQDFRLPGKALTRYRATTKGGRPATEAVAERSASLWRQRLDVPPAALGEVSFSWWVERMLPQASVADADRDDAVARVLFAFDGDHGRLSARTRATFELMALLTGEEPPFATLMYVWDAEAPIDARINSPRSDRVRKWVVDSGPQHLGRWRDHRRNLAADFELAFGEPPGPLRSVAFMTDADNTQGQAHTWYGPVRLG